MNPGVYLRAIGRLNRSWNEAEHILGLRSLRQRQKLIRLSTKRTGHAKGMSAIFDFKNNACEICNRCCTKSAMDSGYFTHSERGALINQNVRIKDFIVGPWKDTRYEPPERCLFLKETGCNIPTEHRSSRCLTYVCRDYLGPQLVQLGLMPKYSKAKKKLLRADRKIDGLRQVPYQSQVFSLGDG